MKKFILTSIVTTSLLVAQFSHVQAERLTVVASVFPLFDFAREVAGPRADVRLLLPPGVDPHSWEPRPSDIVGVSKADIFLYTSDQMEPWAGNMAGAVRGRDVVVVQVQEEMESIISDENSRSDAAKPGPGTRDPHFWLDLSLSEVAVRMIGRILAEKDPDSGQGYRSRALDYATRLEELDLAFEKGLEECSSRKLVTAGHAAFGHLARRYGLEQVSVYGLSPDAEPSPRHLASIVEIVRQNGVKTIFSEEMMNPQMAEVLSRESGAGVMTLNSGANLTAGQRRRGLTFLDIMKDNLYTLMEGLGCD